MVMLYGTEPPKEGTFFFLFWLIHLYSKSMILAHTYSKYDIILVEECVGIIVVQC